MSGEPDFESLLRCLRERIHVDALVLFGSRARDDAFRESDWDVALVSEDFEDRNPLERGLAVLECAVPGIELVHLAPAELMEPDFSYLRCAILEEGVTLQDGGAFRRARARYEARKEAGEIVFTGDGVSFPET